MTIKEFIDGVYYIDLMNHDNWENIAESLVKKGICDAK